ncbi:unnamed protein product [Psylliodes chrysocephalus]|uniref:MADF domain-containing protein n=1 Tax=Psylliodes chrysocephalus TaxID=3402493 RepID=A0A9P0CW04_9CUCU|nr:unnamed protein product [Psylliodes chrysocephala]
MDVERLIEEIRKFPVLYDGTNEKYRNTEYKDRVWKKIATDLEAKGQAAVRQHKYKYEDLLTFLLPYMVERETISNISYTKENIEHEPESNTQEEHSIVEEEESTQQDNADEEPIITTQSSSTQNLTDRAEHSQTSSADSSVTLNKQNTFMKPPLKRKLQREVKPPESASSQLMAYILAEKEAEKRANRLIIEKQVQNPIDAFLAGIARALKSLHPLLFHQAKSTIFSVVQEFELKQLMNNEPIHQFPPSSSNSSPRSVSTPYPSPVENESLNPSQQLMHQQRDSHNNQNHSKLPLILVRIICCTSGK